MDIYELRQALQTGKTIYDLPLRVTYYARVSTEKDQQIHSLTAQVNYYTEFIQHNPNWTFIDGYVDEGLSGTSVGKRENFLRMIEDAKNHAFDFIVTKEISRFSRNTLDSIQYTQTLLHYGVGVLFQSDNINTLMPDAELRLTIMSSIAQDEVRKISERVKFGFKRAIENGVVLGSNRIWGYQKEQGRLIIDEKEAEIVRLIFDLYANRQLGIRAVANYLTDHGYRNTNGNNFSFSTIRGILCNPKYKGWYCGGKSSKVDYKMKDIKQIAPEDWVTYKDENAVPPIVSEALWNKANALLEKRSMKQRSPDRTSYQNKYLYSGKIFCGTHHQPYYRSLYRYQSSEREVWHCREYTRNGKSGCIVPKLYTDELDWIIADCIEVVLPERTELLSTMTDLYSQILKSNKKTVSITVLRRQIDELLRRKDKLLDMNINGRISDEEFMLRNQRANNELEKLYIKLQEDEHAQAQNLEVLQSLETLQQAVAKELTLPEGVSKGIINALLDHIDVFSGVGGITITVQLYAKAKSETYCIQRQRGKPSVCSRQYI